MPPFIPLTDVDRVLAKAFPEGGVFATGGRVRDEVFNAVHGTHYANKDHDYMIAGYDFEEVGRRLEAVVAESTIEGPRSLVVAGQSFAVYKMTLGDMTYDVGLARLERSTGIGHKDFEASFGPDVKAEDDLGRRDFRMNMIAVDVRDGSLVDPHGGVESIKRREIDIVNARAFEEDPLRIVRMAQFAARFEATVTQKTMEAAQASAPLLSSVSAERHYEELRKMLTRAPKPSVGLRTLHEARALQYFIPELCESVGVQQNVFHRFDVWNHVLAAVDAAAAVARAEGRQPDFVDQTAALFHDVGKPRTAAAREDGQGNTFYGHESVGAFMLHDPRTGDGILDRLRYPHDERDTVCCLVANHMYEAKPELSDSAIRRFARRVGSQERVERLFRLRAADSIGSGLDRSDRLETNAAFQERVRDLCFGERPAAMSVKDLAIDGDRVIEIFVAEGLVAPGFKGGPQVGAVLRSALDAVTDDPTVNNTQALETYVAEYAGKNRAHDTGLGR